MTHVGCADIEIKEGNTTDLSTSHSGLELKLSLVRVIEANYKSDCYDFGGYLCRTGVQMNEEHSASSVNVGSSKRPSLKVRQLAQYWGWGGGGPHCTYGCLARGNEYYAQLQGKAGEILPCS